MIITLTGDNSFALKARLHELVRGFVHEHTDMGLERLDGEEASYDRIRESLESLPFLASKKLVVLRIPGANKQFVENAGKLLGNLPETTDVIIVEPKLDKRLGYYKYLHKYTDFQEFKELDEDGLSRWLVDTAKAAGGQLSLPDARLLIDRIGINQQLLESELTKLLHYSPQITGETIRLLVEAMPQSTVFELLDAAFSSNRTRAMTLYDEQRKMKVEPQAILAMIAWQLHVLALVKAAGSRDPVTIAREARLNPYVVRKTLGLAHRLPLQRIKELVAYLLELDTKLKSSSIDADEALRLFLLEITA